jgi:two-component system, LuxR family, response regulator FixJ
MASLQRIVYVVDDDPAIRHSLDRLLNAVDFRVESYLAPNAFLEVADDLSAGCVLLDVGLPAPNGLDVHDQLQEKRPDLPVIVVMGNADVGSAVRAMKAGAADFIEKPYKDDALIAAIESALKRDTQDRAEEMAAAAALVETLSPRERHVLNALASGSPNKVIAFDLGLSVRTVEVHRARMMDRLGVSQFAAAVRFAVLAGLGR